MSLPVENAIDFLNAPRPGAPSVAVAKVSTRVCSPASSRSMLTVASKAVARPWTTKGLAQGRADAGPLDEDGRLEALPVGAALRVLHHHAFAADRRDALAVEHEHDGS